MNSTVTATGMDVTVSAPTSLLISKTSATTGFGATVALDSNLAADAKVAPVSYAGKGESWYKLTDEAMAKVNESGRVVGFTEVADASEASAFTEAKIDEQNVYVATTADYFYDEIWLKFEGKQTGEPAQNKTVNVTAAYLSPEISDTIKNAMHILFVVGDATFTIDMGATSKTATNIVSLVPNATEGALIKIYYFLSGNDTDCKNTNISADRKLSVDLTFTLND